MTKYATVFPAFLAVWLTGCAGVVSLHPLAMPNDKDAVFDAPIAGTWEEVKADRDGTKARYVVARAESGYTVTLADDKLTGTLHLLKVGDRYLADLYCPSDGPSVPVHLFFRLRLGKDTAWVAEMQTAWLKDEIKTRAQLRHEVLMADNDRIVLTASPAELRRYLLPYAADDRSFEHESELRRMQADPKGGSK